MQLGQRQADGPQRADLQEVAPRDAVARVRLAPTGEIEHGLTATALAVMRVVRRNARTRARAQL